MERLLEVKAHLHNLSLLVMSPVRDRKSTRLNSSHSQISYAVFCLKKKKSNRAVNVGTHGPESPLFSTYGWQIEVDKNICQAVSTGSRNTSQLKLRSFNSLSIWLL